MEDPIQFSVTKTPLGWKIVVQSEKKVLRTHEPRHFWDAQEIVNIEFRKLIVR